MLRHQSLVPLSRQHQHALALCVRIERASPIPESDVEKWSAEICRQFDAEIAIHFEAEERVLFPVTGSVPELAALTGELRQEHVTLRAYFSRAQSRSVEPQEMLEFARHLSAHIRKEERRLFERMQECLSAEKLTSLGRDLEEAIAAASQSCAIKGSESETGR